MQSSVLHLGTQGRLQAYALYAFAYNFSAKNCKVYSKKNVKSVIWQWASAICRILLPYYVRIHNNSLHHAYTHRPGSPLHQVDLSRLGPLKSIQVGFLWRRRRIHQAPSVLCQVDLKKYIENKGPYSFIQDSRKFLTQRINPFYHVVNEIFICKSISIISIPVMTYDLRIRYLKNTHLKHAERMWRILIFLMT